MASEFFEEQSISSRKKKDIVVKYFNAWANIIGSQLHALDDQRLCYADLYAGRGCYLDGTESIPLTILRISTKSEMLKEHLVTIFNDVNREYAEELNAAILDLPDIGLLKNEPEVFCGAVDRNLAEKLSQSKLIPTLLFLDPWGYKGISLELLRAVLKDWGCDIIFFFNYNRINSALGNPGVQDHMNDLFGIDDAEALREELDGAPPSVRESRILEHMKHVIRFAGARHSLAFRFANEKGERTSHYLLFATKHARGKRVMIDIMAKSGWLDEAGFPILEFTPAGKQLGLFSAASRRMETLMKSLIGQFHRRTLTVSEIIDSHDSDVPYVVRNYKDTLREMEQKGRITVEPPADERRVRLGVVTLPDNCRIHFICSEL
jgi:three-Cys-motif partner protein